MNEPHTIMNAPNENSSASPQHPMDAALRQALLKAWDSDPRGALGLRYAGEEFKDDQGVVRENVLLTKAAERIRDKYYESFRQLARIYEEYSIEINGIRVEHDDNAPVKTRSVAWYSEEGRAVRIMQTLTNLGALLALKQNDYGFSPEEKAALLKDHPHEDRVRTYKGLSTYDANRMIGSIIRKSIDSFKAATRMEMMVSDDTALPERYLSDKGGITYQLQHSRFYEGSPITYYEGLLHEIEQNEDLRRKMNPAVRSVSQKNADEKQVPDSIAEHLLGEAIQLAAIHANEAGQLTALTASPQGAYEHVQQALEEIIEAADPRLLRNIQILNARFL